MERGRGRERNKQKTGQPQGGLTDQQYQSHREDTNGKCWEISGVDKNWVMISFTQTFSGEQWAQNST